MRDTKQFDNLKSWFRLFFGKISKNSLLSVIIKYEQMFACVIIASNDNATTRIVEKCRAKKRYGEIR